MKGVLFIQLYRSFMNKKKNVTYDDSSPFEPLEGWRIIVHYTDELPLSSSHHFLINYNLMYNVQFKPEVLLINDDLKRWNPKRRVCFLPEEKSLNFFKKYTKRNCELECMSFEILKACNCVAFYMIREFD